MNATLQGSPLQKGVTLPGLLNFMGGLCRRLRTGDGGVGYEMGNGTASVSDDHAPLPPPKSKSKNHQVNYSHLNQNQSYHAC
jgi:hypothetical protein